jgi:hypothetical protein
MTKHLPLIAIIFAASLAGAVSCASQKDSPKPGEDEFVRTGALYFSEGRIAEAAKAWASIPDSAKREVYLTFVNAYVNLDAAVARAEKALSESKPENAIAAVKSAKEPPAAPPAVLSADPRSIRSRREKVGGEAGKALSARAAETEKAADKSLAAARAGGKAKDGVARAGEATEGFSSARRLYLDASGWIPAMVEGASRTEAKAKEAESLYISLLKESLLSFPNKMGELFARSYSSSAKLDDKALLAFAAETAAMISGGISDFEEKVAMHPELLDQATVDRFRASARGLSARFARIESAIKVVKNRGKPVMPIIIGIFNPEPDDPQRSRPASFAGSSAAGPEWWWGIADIPKGVAQDLVVTMSDPRPVRIYAAGLGADGKRPASDLVNPNFRVGNSWPVLNAGARLNDGVFHIEVGPGRGDDYNGVAVVYKSFMMRTR